MVSGQRMDKEQGDCRPLRVLIVSANRLFADGLASLLGHDKLIEVIDGCSDFASAVAMLVGGVQADVALVDCCREDGIHVVREIVSAQPDVKVLAVGISEIDERLVGVFEAGALGYIPSDATLADAIRALHQAAGGEAVCSPRVTATLIRRLASLDSGAALIETPAHLTRRELEVLMLMGEGLSNKEIARMLTLEVATVKNHVHNILQKLHLRRRGQATAWLRSHRAQN